MRKGFFPRLALSGIRKNRSIYYPYILTAVLTTAMMYIIGSLQQISTDYSGTLAFSLQLGIVVTSVFSVVFLFYTNSFLMRRRKKEFGLYNILGMEKRHLARLIFWETGADAGCQPHDWTGRGRASGQADAPGALAPGRTGRLAHICRIARFHALHRRVDQHHVRPDSAQLRASGLRRPSRRALAQRGGGRARARPAGCWACWG